METRQVLGELHICRLPLGTMEGGGTPWCPPSLSAGPAGVLPLPGLWSQRSWRDQVKSPQTSSLYQRKREGRSALWVRSWQPAQGLLGLPGDTLRRRLAKPQAASPGSPYSSCSRKAGAFVPGAHGHNRPPKSPSPEGASSPGFFRSVSGRTVLPCVSRSLETSLRRSSHKLLQNASTLSRYAAFPHVSCKRRDRRWG